MLTKALIKDMLQDIIDHMEEINWEDVNFKDIFEDDLRSDIKNLAKTMYAISGFQSWNGL